MSLSAIALPPPTGTPRSKCYTNYRDIGRVVPVPSFLITRWLRAWNRSASRSAAARPYGSILRHLGESRHEKPTRVARRRSVRYPGNEGTRPEAYRLATEHGSKPRQGVLFGDSESPDLEHGLGCGIRTRQDATAAKSHLKTGEAQVSVCSNPTHPLSAAAIAPLGAFPAAVRCHAPPQRARKHRHLADPGGLVSLAAHKAGLATQTGENGRALERTHQREAGRRRQPPPLKGDRWSVGERHPGARIIPGRNRRMNYWLDLFRAAPDERLACPSP
jgi:hypothetical protein